MDLLQNLAQGIWVTLLAMAPYLLLGFAVAALLARFVTPALVRRHLGEGTVAPVFKATLFGVPLPLCSCGVIPVAASLKRRGANGGATVAFLASTPQTGVDSILVTYSLLGWPLTVVRVVAAFVSGWVSGLLTGWFGDKLNPQEDREPEKGALHRSWAASLRHGLITLPRDIALPLILGLVVAGILSAVVPKDLVSPELGGGPLGKLLMLGMGIPVYVCATASVPVAASFIALGFSPGAALIFLMSGPATNAATLALVWKDLGLRSCLIYLGTIAVTALGAGVLLDRLGEIVSMPVVHHVHVEESPAQVLFAVVLVGLLVYARWIDPRVRRTND